MSKGSDNIAYIYSALGEKLARKMKDNTYQYYAGNMVYKNDKSLSYLLFDEGLVTKTSSVYSYEYHLKDHPPKVGQGPGNTRVTFQPNWNSITTTQVAEYYPFGSSYLPVSPAGTNKYLYNGKEKQDDVLGGTALDWYDYGARFYDPTIGRWHSVDPMVEKHYEWTPYAYVYNNPICLIDPLGLDSTFYSENGSQLYQATGDKGKSSSNYVIKTTKTTDEIYSDGEYNDKGFSTPIDQDVATNAEEQIKNGNLTGDHMSKFVKLNSTTTMKGMTSIVSQDDGSGGTSANNNTENCGRISKGQLAEGKSVGVGNLDNKINPHSDPGSKLGEVEFHSHPSGSSTNRKSCYLQAPTDINLSTGRVNYVYGMASWGGMKQTVYVYNKSGGVIATIPLSIFKK